LKFGVEVKKVKFPPEKAVEALRVASQTHVYMNFFDHKDLGNQLLQLCPKVVKHPLHGHHLQG
jgi:hypothetical protein